MLLCMCIIPDLLTNESLRWGLWLCLTAVSLCIHVSIYHHLDAPSRRCFASIQTQTCRVNAPCAKQIGALCTRKACPGLVILKLKACLFVQPHFQEWGRECEYAVAQGKRNTEHGCDFHSLLSIPLNQKTSGRKGRRIRLAGKGEREVL